jgi:hypothetical protein
MLSASRGECSGSLDGVADFAELGERLGASAEQTHRSLGPGTPVRS